LNVAQFLKHVGASQASFAKMMGVTDRTVRHWVAGTRDTPGPIRYIIARTLGGQLTLCSCPSKACVLHPTGPCGCQSCRQHREERRGKT